ncbi:pentatricopeptide repeat-containing protein At3g24000, mitochondrial [Selaginella moellendorffii]|uniref:pentatricopeptide repeat-containing protein At3g24000, mitochondrial n=1 Tax=Selaginella moellendorffii TaxID=88036 RepID=UPI000D1C9460|nr:pentatricopeptide repeat-containing protein At3g24000, mitochondrial [Selaginella moellendorffii]|eukprot:XP_024532206.1 pentatricopeptide repeat-containing protein At3g24000, mitochondrial [Selaginella moellendorffii]
MEGCLGPLPLVKEVSPAKERIQSRELRRKVEDRRRWKELPREEREEREPWRIKGPVRFEEKYPLWKFYRIPGLESSLSEAKSALDFPEYVKLLKKCGQERALIDGKLVHEHIRDHADDEHDTFLANMIIQMYGKCKSPEDARQVFDRIKQRNAFSWSILVECYVQNAMYQEALEVYKEMVREEISIDAYTLSSVLAACTKLLDVEEGRMVQRKAEELGFEKDVVVATSLIHLFAKCGCLEEAESVFRSMGAMRDIISVTAMIGAYVRHGKNDLALDTYWKMRSQGLEPDAFTYAAILGACSSPDFLLDGKHIHKHILESKHFGNISVRNALITMYAKCGSLKDSKSLFLTMDVKDVVSWNAMIAAYTLYGHDKDAFSLFHRMCTLGHTPDIYTFSSILGACASPKRLEDGRMLHVRITARGFDRDFAMQNNLISMYTRCGSLESARRYFYSIEKKELGAWNTMLAAYAQFDKGKDALFLYKNMLLEGFTPDRFTFSSVVDSCASLGALREGKFIHECSTSCGFEKDVILGTALVNMYAKCGSLADAKKSFDGISNKDVVSWSAMIAASAQHGHAEEALELSHLMNLQGIAQNEVTASSVLHACSHGGRLYEGIDYFMGLSQDFGIERDEENTVGFIDLLGRAGWLKEAEHVLHTMPFKVSFVALVTLLGGCKVHGDVRRGKAFTKRIVALEPENPGSYVLLNNMYAAAGRWDDVAKLRRYMRKKGVKRQTGCSSIEYRDKIYEFSVGDTSNPRNLEIRAELERLYSRMKEEEGYVPDTRDVFHDVSDDKKEELLKFHSEKMAMGFGLITSPPGSTLRIIKNLRVCSDCHTVGKLASKITGRRIIVRDGTRFHHFEGGICSCGDYW